MRGTSRRAARTAAVVALLLLLGAALRARLPGPHAATPELAQDHPASMLAVIALVSAAFLVLAFAIVTSLREPRRALPAAVYDVPGSGVGGRWSRRMVLIGLAAILAWLAVSALIAQLIPPPRDDAPPAATPQPPPAGHSTPQPPPARPAAPDDHVFWVLAALTAALALLVVTASVIVRRRNRPDVTSVPLVRRDTDPAGPESGSESLALAAERGLAEVGDLSREPREAIIACYAAMEDALAGAPGVAPQDSDTPSEVLARAVEHHAIRAERASQLVALFAEARFSTHVMNEGHRDTAERALRLVLDELRTAV